MTKLSADARAIRDCRQQHAALAAAFMPHDLRALSLYQAFAASSADPAHGSEAQIRRLGEEIADELMAARKVLDECAATGVPQIESGEAARFAARAVASFKQWAATQREKCEALQAADFDRVGALEARALFLASQQASAFDLAEQAIGVDA